MGRKGYPPELRRKVLDLVAAGRPVVDVARDLGSQRAVDLHLATAGPDRQGTAAGPEQREKAELTAAKRRIAELEAELAVHRRASELLGKVVPPKGGSRPSR